MSIMINDHDEDVFTKDQYNDYLTNVDDNYSSNDEDSGGNAKYVDKDDDEG